MVDNSSVTYKIKEIFNRKGYFRIKATPLGTNLFLFKEREVGELDVLVVEGTDWFK